MASRIVKALKGTKAGATSKGSGKAPAKGSTAHARMVGHNRDNASRSAGRRTGINYD